MANVGTIYMFPVKNDRAKKKKTAYKYLVMQYYLQILVSSFLPACFLSIRIIICG